MEMNNFCSLHLSLFVNGNNIFFLPVGLNAGADRPPPLPPIPLANEAHCQYGCPFFLFQAHKRNGIWYNHIE